MTTGSILLTIALIIVLLLYLLRPFLTPSLTNQPPTTQQKLLAEKEQLLDQIRALDFDHATNKIPEEAYQNQRYHLIRQAASVAQQLDNQTTNPADIEVAIETAVAQLRQQPLAAPSPRGLRRGSSQPGRFCPQCGQPTDSSDKFCAACGHQLAEVLGN